LATGVSRFECVVMPGDYRAPGRHPASRWRSDAGAIGPAGGV
jgi:hypothetical protein